MQSHSNLIQGERTDIISKENTNVQSAGASRTDYAEILDQYDLQYERDGYYCKVGEITPAQGWILHISSVISELPKMLHLIIPYLASEKVAFKILINKATAERLLDGMFGYIYVGKAVCIYPESDAQAIQLAQSLIFMTASLKGPDIPTDFHLGGTIYTRYGSFNPILQQAADGTITKCIYNHKGELVPDNYSIPFSFPEGIPWPFSSIAAPVIPVRNRLMNEKIKTVELIKNDVKGRVIKGIYLKNWFKSKRCIVKEGKKNMYSDDSGRDIRDRLDWQVKLHSELSVLLPVPKILETFRENDDSYVIMEFIDGISLDEKIIESYQCNTWSDVLIENRRLILDYLLQVIEILKVLHSRGYVHRDVTLVNFLVDKKDKLHMIDLEMVYSIQSKYPLPPFTLGSPGYMSPEQLAVHTPTTKEDIYGLGALMIGLFTGLAPTIFETATARDLPTALNHFIQNEEVATIIARCLDPETTNRPQLNEILDCININYRKLTENRLPFSNSSFKRIQENEITTVIQEALQSLSSDQMTDSQGLWFSKAQQVNSSIANVQGGYANYIGLYEGIAGVFYTLFKLKVAGIPIKDTWNKCYQPNLEFIDRNGFLKLADVPPGLFAGGAGLASMLAAGINSGLLQNVPENIAVIRNCLDLEPLSLDLANGAAGQGVALLQCAPLLPQDYINERLRYITGVLTESQQKDGSWITAVEQQSGKGMKLTGLANGVSGIIYYLLSFTQKSKDQLAADAALRGLSWLQKQAERKDNKLFWFTNTLNREIDPWFLHGVAGIALTFIKAYECFGDAIYKALAEAALNNHAKHLVYRNLTHAWGTAGLGEVYLEAARILQSDEWQHRADWIASSLLHLKKQKQENLVFWTTDTIHNTADLMTGGSGIMHFLARYIYPDRISYPLLGTL